MASEKKIVVIAGPNGAGKTTFALEFLPREADCPDFINVDLIAAGLSPFHPEQAAIRAGRLMLAEIKQRVREEKSFAFETTLSGRHYARTIPRWRAVGYHVKLIFLNLPRRFDSGLRNFHNVYRALVDHWILYDNSGSIPRLVASGDNP